MLTLYVYGRIKTARDVVPPNMEIVTDIDTEFGLHGFKVSKAAEDIVEYVDEGKLIDTMYFTDRFGAKLHTNCLSTGSKAGLLVSSSDKVIDLRECGINAIEAIVLYCRSGYAVLRAPQRDLDGDWDTPVDVMIDGEYFKTLREVNIYFNDGMISKEIEKLIAEGVLREHRDGLEQRKGGI